MNEKRIYEWLGYKDARCFKGGWMYRCDEQFWKSCPPLDYNTAFNEAIPKLEAEGITVTFIHGRWFLQPREPQFEPAFEGAVIYEAIDKVLAAREAE